MSWQEDLAELDRTLAEGRISADDYRRRRDEILASASGGAPAGATPPSTNSGPFAPPMRWDAVQPNPPQNQNPDATQIVSPGAQQANADRTQVVSQRPPDADRTQYVAPITPQANQMPPPQQGGWQSGPPTSTPPWGNDSYSPIGDANPSWIAQGPEVFDDSGGSGKGKVIGIVLAVVLLAGIAFGAYWIWGRGGSSPSADGGTSQTQATATTTTPAPPPDPLPIGKLPGKVSTNKAVTAFTGVPNLKYLLDSESAIYTASGATKTKLVQITLDDGSKGIILIVQGTDATAAAAAALDLHNTQINNGMTQVTGAPAGVNAAQIDAKGDQPARVRAHYSSKDLIVRIDYVAPTLAGARKSFDNAVEAELEVLPADG